MHTPTLSPSDTLSSLAPDSTATRQDELQADDETGCDTTHSLLSTPPTPSHDTASPSSPPPLALRQGILSPLSLLFLLPFPSLQSLLLSTLSLGPIPRHVAFVMDGNRRWAVSSNSSIRHGHLAGFATLKSILQVCLNLRNLTTVTVYAFAIDNFKRKKGEVDALMDIAKTRLLQLAGHGEVVARHKVRIRVVGRKELLPVDVRKAVDRVEEMTRGNRGATLNICMPYASRDEMAGAVRGCVGAKLKAVEKWSTRQNDTTTSTSQDHSDADDIDYTITPHSLSTSMQLAHSPPLDILVRTSGVARLSDFMLWQCNSRTQLHFVDKYWPQFGLADLVPIILDWQRQQITAKVQAWCDGDHAREPRQEMGEML